MCYEFKYSICKLMSMIQEVAIKLKKRIWHQSELEASAYMRLYGQELGIQKNIIDEAALHFFDLKIEQPENVSNNQTLAAVCLIIAVKRNRSPITPKVIIEFYRERRHRISKKVANRIMLDMGIKNPIITPETFLQENIRKLSSSEEVQTKIAQRKVKNKTYWELIEKTTRSYLSFLNMSYKGGSPPSLLSAYGLYLADKILHEFYIKENQDGRAILSKRIVSNYTGSKISSCSSQLIAKMNQCLNDNLEKIREDIKEIVNLLN